MQNLGVWLSIAGSLAGVLTFLWAVYDGVTRPNGRVRRSLRRAKARTFDRLVEPLVAPLQREIADLEAHQSESATINARLHEFKLEEYRARRKACSALLMAVHHSGVMSVARYDAQQALKASRRFPSPESLGRAQAGADGFKTHSELADRNVQEAFAVLSVDESASQVVELYRSLPFAKMLDNPEDVETKQAWRARTEELRRSILAYLRPFEEELHLTRNDKDRQL